MDSQLRRDMLQPIPMLSIRLHGPGFLIARKIRCDVGLVGFSRARGIY
jgi:hypothetical protein